MQRCLSIYTQSQNREKNIGYIEQIKCAFKIKVPIRIKMVLHSDFDFKTPKSTFYSLVLKKTIPAAGTLNI